MFKLKLATLNAATFLLVAMSAYAEGLAFPKPNPERGGIAVTMRARLPAGNKKPVDRVHFVRLGSQADMFAAESVVASSFSKEKQVYLLNAEPGRYVAVAADLGGANLTTGEFKVFFDKATIAETEVEVTPGRIAFMGDFLIDLKVKMNKSDEAQAHYFLLIAPDAAAPAKKGFFSKGGSSVVPYRGDLVSVDREASTQTEFWTLARDKVFDNESAWRAEIEEELGN